jgi:hypothetical protein
MAGAGKCPSVNKKSRPLGRLYKGFVSTYYGGLFRNGNIGNADFNIEYFIN